MILIIPFNYTIWQLNSQFLSDNEVDTDLSQSPVAKMYKVDHPPQTLQESLTGAVYIYLA